MNSFTFDGIAGGQRLPGSAMEFSNARALTGLPAAQQKILLVGQRTSAGTVLALLPRRITSADQAANFFGRGSMLHGMAVAAFLAVTGMETWAIALDDDAGGTAATWTITLTGPASAAGTLSYLIGGVAVNVPVASGDSATAMGAAVAAAVNALPDLPVTAGAVTGTVTLTLRHRGTCGNDLDVRQNHYDGQSTPAGVTSVIAAGVVGATNPDLATVWAALGDEQYQAIAVGINDATNLTTGDTELASRWGPSRMIEGRQFAAHVGNFSTVAAFGATRNGIHTTVAAAYKMPTPPWKVAAAIAAVYAFNIQIDPARPLTGLVLPGLIAPRVEHRFTKGEREQLLGTAISTLGVSAAGDVTIERLITTYRVNTFNLPDVSWLDVTTPATLAYYRFSWRQRMATKFPRAKLTDDTINAIRAETIALARDWEEAGLMEDVDGFIAGLVIERDATNRTQLNVLMTPDTVNGLLQLFARVEFIL